MAIKELPPIMLYDHAAIIEDLREGQKEGMDLINMLEAKLNNLKGAGYQLYVVKHGTLLSVNPPFNVEPTVSPGKTFVAEAQKLVPIHGTDSVCPKCGSARRGMIGMGKDGPSVANILAASKDGYFGRYDITGIAYNEEHDTLLIKCFMCGYERVEAPLERG